jgi:hypothetical protein
MYVGSRVGSIVTVTYWVKVIKGMLREMIKADSR